MNHPPEDHIRVRPDASPQETARAFSRVLGRSYKRYPPSRMGPSAGQSAGERPKPTPDEVNAHRRLFGPLGGERRPDGEETPNL